MKMTATILAIIGLTILPSIAAHAGYADGYGAAQTAHHGNAYHGAAVARYGASTGNLPGGPCQQAARMGGPCGCFAEGLLLGRYDHVLNGINMWLAPAWLAFQRVPAGPGTAGVMPGHVVAILADNGDGTVRVHDSWQIHNISKRRFIAFVDPRQRRYASR